MGSITMNFDDSVDINTVYNQLKKQYPKFKISKNDTSLDEMLEDEYLSALVLERKKNDSGIKWSAEEVYEELGITADELDEIPMEYGVDFR